MGTKPARSAEELPQSLPSRSPLAALPLPHGNEGTGSAEGSSCPGRAFSFPRQGSHLYRGSGASASRVLCRTQGPDCMPGTAHGLTAAILEQTMTELAPSNCPTPGGGRARGCLHQGEALLIPPHPAEKRGREGRAWTSLIFQQQESKQEWAGGSNKPQGRPVWRAGTS